MTSALAIFFRLAARAPRLVRLARPVFVRLAWLCAPAVRRGTAANAARLCPDADPRDFGLAVLGSFYDFVADVGRSRSVTPAALLARVARADGVDRYRAARRAGRGAVLVTAHMGSFEVGLAALSADERRVHVVFKRDAVPAFDVIRSELRDKLGVAEAAVDDGPAVWARLREALLRDEVVTVQGDRVLASAASAWPSAAVTWCCRPARSSSRCRPVPRWCRSSPPAGPTAGSTSACAIHTRSPM
jgi:lauroyl/myristoyl acyltransferase